MSKTTKIIAALGVVAGLGVAALPAFTYAVEPITGDVEVQVDVQPAIAMTITGNNDGGANANGVWTAVASPTGNPSTSNYYEYNSETHLYAASTDTEVDAEKTYYTLVTPSYNAVANYSPSTIKNSVLDGYNVPNADPVLGTSSSYWTILPNSLLEGDRSSASPQNSFGSTVTVYTNNTSGYALSLKDKDANTDLTHTSGQFRIPAQGSALQAGTAGWNYDVTLVAGETRTPLSTNNAISAAGADIDSLNTKTSGGRTVVVDYNVATNADQATGVYTDTIVYTATTND